MKHIILIVTIFILCCTPSCNKPKDDKYQPGEEYIFNGSFDDDSTTKTSADYSGKVYWSPSEEINVFLGSSSSKFITQNTEKTKNATFIGTLPIDANSGFNTIMSLYPYDKDATCTDGYITTIFSDCQIATDNSFAEKSFASIAKTTIHDNNLSFKNVCGGLKFTVGIGGIKRVILKGNNGEEISGKIKIHFGESGHPETEILENEGKTEIELVSENGLIIGATYYIVTLPTTFTNGVTLRLETDKQYADKVYYTFKSIKRSVWGNMGKVDDGLTWKSLELINH